MKNNILFLFVGLLLFSCATIPSKHLYKQSIYKDINKKSYSASYLLNVSYNPMSDWKMSETTASKVIEKKLLQSKMFDDVKIASIRDDINFQFKIGLIPSEYEYELSMLSSFFLTALPVWMTQDFIMRVKVNRRNYVKEYQYRDDATGIMWLPMVLVSPFLTGTNAAEQILIRNLDKLIDDMVDDGFFSYIPEKKSIAINENRKPIGYGTGFIINDDGYILTNNHVIANSDLVKVYFNGKLEIAKIIGSDKNNDIALLKIENKTHIYLNFSDVNCKTGDDVFTMGFPNIELQGKEPKYTKGIINSISGFDNDYRLYQISVPIQPGNSGGPLINDKGLVVGMVTSTLSSLYTLFKSGTIPQNVNYAIKSSYIKPFVDNFIKISKKSVSDTTIIENTKKAIIIVVSY